MSLYLDHYGLREPPFRITPHTDFFFHGANRGPTLEALIFAITQDEGIVKVTGEVGSGKTMLCRMLLERLPDNIESLYLANPSLSRQEILCAIADELGIPADGKATHSLTRAIQDALIERYSQGKRVVVLIDEAHAMPSESLEEIRLLSNLESKATKLLQIALFAQPELDERLAANDMRQLRERITQHFNLAPLKPQDVSGYLEFRLRTAGYKGPHLFSEAAISAIAKTSEGLSRRINILADKALLAAYAKNSYQVGTDEISIATQDARFSPLQPKREKTASPPLLWTLIGAGIASTAIAVYLSQRSTVQEAAPFEQARPPNMLPVTTPAPNTENKGSASVATPSESPIATPAEVPSKLAAVDAPAEPVVPTPHPDRMRFGPLTRKHMAQYDKWIATASNDRYFIQLSSSDASQFVEIEAFLSQATTSIDTSKLLAYRSSLSGRDRIGIIFGDYPSREAATLDLNRLPASIRASQPFPRQVSKLR